MICPCCGRKQTGQVGTHEFYCWNCCVEFHGEPGQWRLFEVDEEGALVELAAPEAGELLTPSPAALQSAGAPAPA